MAAPFAPVRPPADDHGHVRVVEESMPPGTTGGGTGTPPRRTIIRVLAGTLVLVAVVGGLTLLADRAGDAGPAGEPAGAGPAPSSSVAEAGAPVTVADGIAEPTLDTVTTVATVATVVDAAPIPVADRLAELEAERQAVLATIERVSFTATVTTSFTGQPDSTQRHDVIVHADGSLWVTDPGGGWQSFDPNGGTVRAAWPDGTGSLQFQELSGQSSSHLPLSVGVGITPPWTPISVAPEADTMIDEVVVDGRPAWLVVSRSTPLAIPPATASGDQFDSWTIDQGTGFIVASSMNTALLGPAGAISGRSVTTATLDDLTVGTPLPEVFPGSFPADAPVTRNGAPSLAPSPGPADVITAAQAAFGDEFFLPTVQPSGTILYGDPSQPWFEATWPNGFASPTMLRFATLVGTEGDASCPDCTGSMLDELRSVADTAPQTLIRRHGIWINFMGPNDDAIRELIASIP